MRHNPLIHTNVQGKSITHSPTLTHKTEYYSFIQTHIQDKGRVLLIHSHTRELHYSFTHTPTQDKELLTHPFKWSVLVYYSSTLTYKVRVTHPSTLPHKMRGRVLLIHLNSHTWEEYYSFIQTHIQDKGSVLLSSTRTLTHKGTALLIHPNSHTRYGKSITHSSTLTHNVKEYYSST